MNESSYQCNRWLAALSDCQYPLLEDILVRLLAQYSDEHDSYALNILLRYLNRLDWQDNLGTMEALQAHLYPHDNLSLILDSFSKHTSYFSHFPQLLDQVVALLDHYLGLPSIISKEYDVKGLLTLLPHLSTDATLYQRYVQQFNITTEASNSPLHDILPSTTQPTPALDIDEVYDLYQYALYDHSTDVNDCYF